MRSISKLSFRTRSVFRAVTVLLLASMLSSCATADTPSQQTEIPAPVTASPPVPTPFAEAGVEYFFNPVSDKSMPDPFITYYDGWYYGLATEVVCVKLYKSRNAQDLFRHGACKELIKTGDDIGGGKTLGWNAWAPELHFIPSTGRWYVYFCASTNGFEFDDMRMMCLESDGSDPFGDYTFKGITLGTRIGIDQTVYCSDSGQLYTAYCVFTENKGQAIALSDMDSPWKVGKKKFTLTSPEYDWEKRGSDEANDGRVNEGPVFLKHNGQLVLIYSASGCWSEWYCLGMLKYIGPDETPENFLKRSNWEKVKEPVFSKANGVYGVGHCSFFTSPDGSEVYMAYHGMATPDAGVEGRYAYIKPISFDENDLPVLGEPPAREEPVKAPGNTPASD